MLILPFALFGMPAPSTGGIIWAAGVETRDAGENAFRRANGIPRVPGPGPSVRPPAAAISVTNNSGDVPIPNWTGVEVEADVTHNGSAPAAAGVGIPAENTVRITRRREFTLTAPTDLQFAAAVSGIVSATTAAGPGNFAHLDVDPALSIVGPGVPPPFFFDGTKNDVVDIGPNASVTNTRYFKGVHQQKVLPKGAYFIESDLKLSFSHVNATVDYKFMDPAIGPDGIIAGTADELGLEAVIRPKDRRVIQKNKDGRTGATTGSNNGLDITYDANNQTLSFTPSVINVADLVGGMTNAVSSEFSGDPLLGAFITVSDLLFNGFSADGRAHFSGGSLRFEKAGLVFLEGFFSEFVLGDSTQNSILDSFALVDQIVFDSNFLYSPLLEALFNVTAADPTVTTDLYFVTADSLLAETNGLTETRTLRGSIYFGGSKAVPILPTPLLFLPGLLSLIFLKRRLSH